ncbi:adhesion G-protein coupled receptor D1-like [Penaeus japonicus]|uniref:adhesion G-protein coupled receptor D1-like n=1 Tax=Penaeus japonicus TaxID=27405 RepID=UPI001C7178C3|nr:adhesion G-protein coupled receptor D1-like [Penaeus japonicus]
MLNTRRDVSGSLDYSPVGGVREPSEKEPARRERSYLLQTLCRVISILIHYFFTACFIFMTLEALHMYSLVAYVVKKDGMFTRVQNTVLGWGLAAFIIMFCMCFEYDNYGGEYHCWLRMDTPLLYGQYIPVVGSVIMTFTLIEAAGAADYKPLKG